MRVAKLVHMKYINNKKIYLRILFLSSLFFLSTTFMAKEPRPKIGLVLSGGGARGLAHIGTLKLIDSLQIPIDYIVGTSMGGIIGGLYAAGYSGNEIERYALDADWNEILKDKPPRSETPYLEKKDDGKFQIEFGFEGLSLSLPSGLIGGQNISLRLANLTSAVGTIRDFDKLPIPFRCVAIDLLTGDVVILKDGSLSKAMRATMSIPTVFSPVEWGDSLLIDGGVLNNFPADVLKEMGADIIIGVNVGSQLAPREDIKSLLDVLEQTMVLTDYPKQKENYKLCDVLIKPELDGFTTTDFDEDQVNEIIRRGNAAATENKKKFLEFKNKYVYDPFQSIVDGKTTSKKPLITTIILAGGSSYTLEYLYQLIGHSPNDSLDLIKLQDNISAMKTSGLFSEVEYSIQLIGAEIVKLHFKLTEKKQPIIHGFTIYGNENLHFDFILDILGLRAGDPFSKEKLDEQIRYMSGLGYFEEITYIIEPERENFLRVIITVKERPLRKLRIGFRYDDRYKIVGILGLQATNTPFLGMREELFIQFAGLFKAEYIAFYPSRTLNFPLYPYFTASYKDVPVDIFDFATGERTAEYNDRSWKIGGGFGHIITNTGVIKVEYHHEYINVDPNIAGLGPDYESWNDENHVLHADLSIDRIDDPLTPRYGYSLIANYDFSSKKLGSDLKYSHYQIDAKYHTTISNNHTFSLSGYYTNAFYDYPIYKWPFKGGSDTFVGMKINQIEGYNFGYLRFDYRFEFKKDLFVKAIINTGRFNFVDPGGFFEFNGPIYGYGIGITYLTIAGPFEIVFSQGSKSLAISDEFQNVIYFTAGYIF